MQDNRWDDEQFTDFAWSEMQKMLDEEMPVRGGIFWFRRRGWMAVAAAVLLLVSAGLWWQLSGWENRPEIAGGDLPERAGQLADQQPESGAQAPAPFSDRANAAQSQNGSDQSLPGALEKSQVQAKRGEKTPAVRESELAQPAIAGRTSPGAGADRPEAPRLPANPASGETPAAGLGEVAGSQAQQLETSPDKTPALPQLARRPLQWSPPLPSLALAAPNQTGENTLQIQAGSPAAQKAAAVNWLPDRWGIQGGALSGAGPSSSGLSFGLAADYRLGKSRWTLQGNLRYLYQNRNFSFQEPGGGSKAMAESDNGRVQDTLGLSSGSQRSNLNLFPIASKIHSLNLPVLLNYRAGKVLGLQLGVQMNYTLLAQRTDQPQFSTTTLNNQVYADSFTNKLINTGQQERFSVDLLQRWDLGLTGGAEFRISQDLSMQLRYNLGLMDLVRSDYFEAYNRFFGLGLTYYLR